MNTLRTTWFLHTFVRLGISLTRLVDNFTTGHIRHSSCYRAG
ncbi:hypothetical protein [Paenibacillus sp. yr247]|nr:hypothetical protein [Paenibacillus sp. yr247]